MMPRGRVRWVREMGCRFGVGHVVGPCGGLPSGPPAGVQGSHCGGSPGVCVGVRTNMVAGVSRRLRRMTGWPSGGVCIWRS